MLTQDFAVKFAREWAEAWNSRDLERILGQYATDVELTSPFVSRILGGEADTVRGVAALRNYFRFGLTTYPDLRFVPRRVYAGVRSVVVEYESVGGSLSAEMMEFDEAGQVRRVRAHYSKRDPGV